MATKFFKILIIFAILFPSIASAGATLFVSPDNGTYSIGDLFSVLVNVNTGGQPINAVSGQINFDNSRLQISSLGFAKSILTIWTEEPSFSNEGGVVRFSGGVPNPGYTGASGSILRITFQPKAKGQASVIFISGSVLANDGKGTNILDNLKGGIYSVVAVAEKPIKTETIPTAPLIETKISKITTPPVITSWQETIEEGTSIKIHGLAYPSSKVVVFFQYFKDSEEPISEETYSGPDGRFSITYSKKATVGVYRIWAKSVNEDGISTSNSETVNVEVRAPLFFRFGSLALEYSTIIVTLLALLFLMVALIVWAWVKFRKWQQRQGKEISEAEQILHQSFTKLREGLSSYIGYLTETKSKKGIELREMKTKQELKEELGEIEKSIEKEIKDIKKKKEE